ncbi:MAG TPA: saccharopine dehydrogenase NADP-binding domain-containing protein, partial [Solirubrobacteraceae bacterium]|nr:saccharopine dehydrogenase NADP-binding domain-containing protein [Solirubrobacteraceae bacterium]
MNWRTVLVLGGYGETGRRLVRLLVERTDARVVVAGRDYRRATALAAELGADGVRGIGLDAADAPSVRRALEGVDLLVNLAVVPRHVAALARTALATGTDWLDFQIHRGQARILDEMANEIAAAGRCFVTQAGFHPGVPAALVRWAAQRVDELRGAWIASVLAERDGLPATSGLDELVASFRDYRAMRYENGRWRQLAGGRPSDYPVVDFGFGFGRRRTFVMEFDELLSLPDRLPGLRRLGFSITMDAATNVASSLILPALAVTGARPRAPS